MHRRLVAAFGVLTILALLAGCSAAGSISMDPVSDGELVEEASRTVADLPAAHEEDGPSPRAVVRAAVANGSTNATALSPPVRVDGYPFEVDGAYYDLRRTVVDTHRTNAVTIGVDYNGTAPNGTAIAYADLPKPDREALDSLLPPRDVPLTDGPEVGVSERYTDAELNASALAPTQRYDAVVFEGERYALRVEGPRSVTAETYRYEAIEVSPNASAYASHLRETYAFTLANLTDAERSVVEEAAGGSYYADSTDDDAFESVLDRFRARQAVLDRGSSGTWLVRYNGTLYRADLSYGAFTAD